MNLSDTIYAHAQALPIDLQREALDFIAYLEQRYCVIPKQQPLTTTEAFLARFAGCLSNDFPDEIGDADLASFLFQPQKRANEFASTPPR